MPRIGRNIYHRAMLEMILKVGYKLAIISNKTGKFIIYKNTRNIYVDMVGRNLPYFGTNGVERFEWETYINPKRLDSIEYMAREYGAEAWIGYCYAIISEDYYRYFNTIVNIAGWDFGAKFIDINSFREYAQERSPSWKVVCLPRDNVPFLTKNLEDI